jgi:hypothetical protein
MRFIYENPLSIRFGSTNRNIVHTVCSINSNDAGAGPTFEDFMYFRNNGMTYTTFSPSPYKPAWRTSSKSAFHHFSMKATHPTATYYCAKHSSVLTVTYTFFSYHQPLLEVNCNGLKMNSVLGLGNECALRICWIRARIRSFRTRT